MQKKQKPKVSKSQDGKVKIQLSSRQAGELAVLVNTEFVNKATINTLVAGVLKRLRNRLLLKLQDACEAGRAINIQVADYEAAVLVIALEVKELSQRAPVLSLLHPSLHQAVN